MKTAVFALIALAASTMFLPHAFAQTDLLQPPSADNSGDLSTEDDPFYSERDAITGENKEDVESELYKFEGTTDGARPTSDVMYQRQLQEEEAKRRAQEEALRAQQEAVRGLLQQGGVNITNGG